MYFLKHFSNIIPVPNIINFTPATENIQGAILMEYLPGDTVNLANISNNSVYLIGKLLATIHSNKLGKFGDLTQEETLEQDPQINFTKKFNEGITECTNHLPEELLKKCQNYYNDNLEQLKHVDGPCIIHRDFRPANIIINKGEIQGIIDWSSARASFTEDDFCAIEHLEWQGFAEYKRSFFAGYSSIRKIPDYTSIMPLLLLNRALSSIGFTIKRNTWNNVNAKFYKDNLNFIYDFLATTYNYFPAK